MEEAKMTRDELKQIFPEATPEQVDALMGKYGSELNPLKKRLEETQTELKQKAAELNKSLESGALLKNQLEGLDSQLKSKMSAEELLKQREEEAAKREKEFLIKSNTLDARDIFSNAGITGDIATELVALAVSENQATTKQRAESIVKFYEQVKESVTQSVKDETLKQNPKLAGVANDGSPVSKADFFKLSYEKQLELKGQNPNILNELE